MKYFVRRTDKGMQAVGVPGKELPDGVMHTFGYTLGRYGYLIPKNVKVDATEWLRLISNCYGSSPRIEKSKEAIRLTMPL